MHTRLSHLAIAVLFTCCLSCDFISPQKKFRLAAAQSDFSYGYSAEHLQKLG